MTVTLYYLVGCVLGKGVGFVDISTAECVVDTFTSIHIKGKSEKRIYNKKTTYNCMVVFQSMTFLIQPAIPIHTLVAN